METALLLAELGRLLGMDDLKLNVNGVASLQFDKRMTTHFEPMPDGEHLLMYAAVCKWPEEPSEQVALATMFLEANLWGRGTAGSVFALDSGEGEIVLERQIPLATVTSDSMRRQLEQFVEVVDLWMTRILTKADHHEPGPDAESTDDGQTIIFG